MATAICLTTTKLSLSLLLILSTSLLLTPLSSALLRDFSIVGYTQDDLSSAGSLLDLFEAWLVKHCKGYDDDAEEKQRRFEIFKDNLKHVDETNKKKASYWLGLNEFADMTHEEFKERYLGVNVNLTRPTAAGGSRSAEGFMYESVRMVDLPKAVDWRKKGAVAHVKNQGQCGSCWAFSTVAAVEGINKIVTGSLTSLSEQELIDCDTEYNNGCNGGLMDNAFSFIVDNGGLRTEDDYPYLMEEGTCAEKRDEASVVTISGYQDVPVNNETALLMALAHQPVSVAIEASGRDFQFYSGGVFDGHCGDALDHGVTAVGYGTSKGNDYIIVKNSWGPKWGEKGYIRMKRKVEKPQGICGIYKMASFPTKTK